MTKTNPFIHFYNRIGLVYQIIFGMIAGIILATVSKEAGLSVAIFGTLFINALKSVAPILVLVLVAAAIANHDSEKRSNMRPLVTFYFIGMFCASLTAVLISFAFPSLLTLKNVADIALVPPESIQAVLMTLLYKMVDNPFNAVVQANYIGLIVWGVALGLALRQSADSTKTIVNDLSFAITYIVKIVIRFAPVGVFGLVAAMIAETGFSELANYAHLLVVLVGCMLFVALVVNPLIAFYITRRNPYPLVFIALKYSGIPAFFTRSSAANIPVNMDICKRLKFDEDTYSVAVPLGATINMSGAAITITVLTLAAANSLNIDVSFSSALLLSVVSAVCACGASGVAGGSLLLIPVACSMFNISNDIAMQVVGIGVAIGVIQDSVETAVNSSTDIVFIGAISLAKEGNEVDLNG